MSQHTQASAFDLERAEQLSSQRGDLHHPLLSAHLNDYTVRFLGQSRPNWPGI